MGRDGSTTLAYTFTHSQVIRKPMETIPLLLSELIAKRYAVLSTSTERRPHIITSSVEFVRVSFPNV